MICWPISGACDEQKKEARSQKPGKPEARMENKLCSAILASGFLSSGGSLVHGTDNDPGFTHRLTRPLTLVDVFRRLHEPAPQSADAAYACQRQPPDPAVDLPNRPVAIHDDRTIRWISKRAAGSRWRSVLSRHA